MAIPDYESLMKPLLELASAANNDGVKVANAIDQLAARFKLTEKERTELLPSGGTFRFSSRVSWARTLPPESRITRSTKKRIYPYYTSWIV